MALGMFCVTVAAVFFGNALSALFIYTMWRMTKIEAAGGSSSDLPASLLIGGLIGPLGSAAALYWLVT